jgi:hypothetical protein
MFPILADFLSTLGGELKGGMVLCIAQLSLQYRPVMLSLPYWPGLLYRPVLLLAQPSPVLYRPGRAVRSPTLQSGPPVPARPAIGLPSPVPTCPALLQARSSFLAVPAWAHGEEPYSYPVPARHALFALPIPTAWPIHHKQLIT